MLGAIIALIIMAALGYMILGEMGIYLPDVFYYFSDGLKSIGTNYSTGIGVVIGVVIVYFLFIRKEN